jgi:hypothetical protein
MFQLHALRALGVKLVWRLVSVTPGLPRMRARPSESANVSGPFHSGLPKYEGPYLMPPLSSFTTFDPKTERRAPEASFR